MLDVHLSMNAQMARDVRHTQLSRCLLQHELDEWWEIQAMVNSRRPLTTTTAEWIASNTAIAERTKARYEPPPRSHFREGYYVGFDYFSEEDILSFAAFLARCCPLAVERFATNQCPRSIYAVPDSGELG